MDTHNLNPFQQPRAAVAGVPRGLRRHRLGRWLVAAGLALGVAAAARAADVYWSIGIHQPGVSVGVSNAPPVVVAPAPRWHAATPVVVMPPRVVYVPAPVRVVTPPGHWKARHHRHRDWDERRDRAGRHDWRDRRDGDWRRDDRHGHR